MRDQETPGVGAELAGRWKMLVALAVTQLLALSLWFSGSAVVPQMTVELGLGDAGRSWLTLSVQLGFAAGALASAVANLADRGSLHRMFAGCAIAGAVCNACATVPGLPFGAVVGARFLTGVMLAGVYPVGMKLMATWFSAGRGMAIGVLVGALTVGSALPHLLNAVPVFGGEPGLPPWRGVMLASSVIAAAGGLVAAAAIHEGPLLRGGSRFDWRMAGRIFTSRAERRAQIGYMGHMWELYAMWTWAPIMVLRSFEHAGRAEVGARLVGFGLIAIGGLSSVLAGVAADRVGRTTVTIASLAVSGACALVAGFLFDRPVLLAVVCLVWGLAVIADSAQFSAAISELADRSYVGTSMTMQTCTGFLLSVVSIRLVPWLEGRAGWGVAFAALAIGPAIGAWAMWRLRRSPEAGRLAGGRR